MKNMQEFTISIAGRCWCPDPDHAGGLADFPTARVHLSEEELAHIRSGHCRYVASQFDHAPDWQPYGKGHQEWFGLEARPLSLGFSSAVLLIPLFGHTEGYCGVAVQQRERWNDERRRASLNALRRLLREHGDEIDITGYHDITELQRLSTIKPR
ncbi:MAG: hypothetical protein JNL58_14695 [Planctomyces sp.]|nr:hypothetical protein [Planctomyces sp.]